MSDATTRPSEAPHAVETGPAELAAQIDALAGSYLPATVLFAAVDLGLFGALVTPGTTSELAGRLGASEDGIARLCRVLATMGLVSSSEGTLSLPPAARLVMSKDGPFGRAELLRHHRRHLLPPLLHLADAVRTGRPQHAAWSFAGLGAGGTPYDALASAPDEYASFLAAMDLGSVGVGTAIAERVDLTKARLLVDLGCGGGVVARELLSALPALHVQSFDLDAARAFAARRSEEAGLATRHTISVGDALRGVATRDADAVLLSAVLADFPRPERVTILRHAKAALRNGGRVLVSETLLDDDRAGPPRAAMLSLVLLAAMRGDQLSFADLARELREAGFVDVEVFRGPPRDLVTARAGAHVGDAREPPGSSGDTQIAPCASSSASEAAAT